MSLSLSSQVGSNSKEGRKHGVESVVPGLYLVNCAKTWEFKKSGGTFFPSEQHGKNITWENQAPQSFSTHRTNILTDPPLHPDRECLGQPPTRKHKQGGKTAGKVHTPASGNLSCCGCVLSERSQGRSTARSRQGLMRAGQLTGASLSG